MTAGTTPDQNARPAFAFADQKTASGFFSRREQTRARKFCRKLLNSRRVARPATTKSASGVRYYGFRYYNPSVGRWLSRDPIQEQGGLNVYGMLNNDPVNFVDFIGLDVFLYFWDSSQGASGSGHVGIGAGTADKQGFFEANPEISGNNQPMRQPYRIDGSLNEVIKHSADFVDYGQAPKLVLRFKSCPAEDKKVIAALQSWYEGHPKWELFTSNCADGAKCGLRSINIPTDRALTYSTPQELARYLYNAYSAHQDMVEVVSGDWLQYSRDNATRGVATKQVDAAKKSLRGKVDAIIKSVTTQ